MKKLLVILFSLLISFNSNALWWFPIVDSTDGDSYFIDIDTIKSHNNSVFYWRLKDYLRPNNYGALSSATYYEGDCSIYKIRVLSFVFYEKSMGEGDGDQSAPLGDNGDWRYPSPSSVDKVLLDYVCDYVD
jgi:hypothetical protein